MTQHGIVEFFNNEVGWGKIVAHSGEPFFVHHRDITDPRFFPDDDIDKFRTLRRGQRVMFLVSETNKPMNAAYDVIIVEESLDETET